MWCICEIQRYPGTSVANGDDDAKIWSRGAYPVTKKLASVTVAVGNV